MKRNIIFHNSNNLNMSNSSEKDLNDILTDDLLSYSEDKSQTCINIYQNNENKQKINNNEIEKNTENIINSNNSEKTIYFLNKNKSPNKKNEKNKLSDSNKDLSSLQVSLSNLLSDIDSKDILFSQNNKINEKVFNNNINKRNKNIVNSNYNSENENELKDISNENKNKFYIYLREKKNTNDEHSSSVCNYSQSLQNTHSINNNNEIKYINSIENNYIVNSNSHKQKKLKNSKNILKYNKSQNINNNDNINTKEKKVSKFPIINQKQINNKKIKNEIQININKINNSSKVNYQIEKRENIHLSNKIKNGPRIDTLNENYIYNNYNNSNKINSFLSISKTQNFTINSSSNLEYNNNITEYYNAFKKDNITSMEIIKEILKNNKLIEKINTKINNKNKIKLINNKNIEIYKEESKKFFYNPKKKNKSNEIFYINKNNNPIKNNKTINNLNIKYNNKTKEYIPPTDRNNNKKEKNITLNNYNDKKFVKTSKNKLNHYKNNNNNSYTYNISKNNKSYNKNILKKENKNLKEKLYMRDRKKTISDLESYNNLNKRNKNFLKFKNITRNIKIGDISTKKNYSISYNQNCYELKKKNIYISNEYTTDPVKPTSKKKCKNDYKNVLMNKIKSVQQKASNKLLNKITNLNNVNINNNNNKGTVFPIFSKILKSKKINLIKNNNKVNKKVIKHESGGSLTLNRPKLKINKISKDNNNNCLTDNKHYKKEKEKDKNINGSQHNKINTQINLASILNNFKNKETSYRKNNKSLFNFGNIFFINQSHSLRKDSDFLSSNIYERSNNEINKEKIIIVNDNYDNSKLNSLNYSIIKQKPQIINDFSNYKRKGNNKTNKIFDKNIELNILKNMENEFTKKRADTDINDNIKNAFNISFKVKDSFKLKKVEGDLGNDIIKEI